MALKVDIAGIETVSRVELIRLKRETAIWLDGLQHAALRHGFVFVASERADLSGEFPRDALGRDLYAHVLATMDALSAPARSQAVAAAVRDGSASVYLNYWLTMLAEVGVRPVPASARAA